MNNVLAYDTSGESLTISIRSQQGISHYRYEFGLRHGEILGDRVEKALFDHGLRPRDLDGIVCSRGPGSFTGLRIGMAFGKGLAEALDIPIVSISPLESLAYNGNKLFPNDLLLPVIDGKKRRYFWALYNEGILKSGPGDWTPQQIHDLLIGMKPKKTVRILAFDKPGFRELLLNMDSKEKIETKEILDRDLAPLSAGFLEIGLPQLVRGERDPHDQGPDYLRESQAIEDKK
ncbi:MAG: tRNA (adenosine(37)-N6)-threonylcarbamoyltransferase complex dimerization subunit type 1 TsaB [Spirochaetales bacterium]|nr:tRNA (adenosine(37)-N6)-threonylcarbamoyltransferase complex dimerization subunit type 1 TsaB [Spirochaetales bacterium]